MKYDLRCLWMAISYNFVMLSVLCAGCYYNLWIHAAVFFNWL